MAFYSHTIDRCQITKEEEEEKKTLILWWEGRLCKLLFLFWNRSNNSNSVLQIFPIEVIAKKQSNNSCSVLQSSFTLSRQFIQETKFSCTVEMANYFSYYLIWILLTTSNENKTCRSNEVMDLNILLFDLINLSQD